MVALEFDDCYQIQIPPDFITFIVQTRAQKAYEMTLPTEKVIFKIFQKIFF